MRIYQVLAKVNVYQALFPEDPNFWRNRTFDFDCSPMAEKWVAPPVYCLEPLLKKGDFLNFCAGTLAATPEAIAKVRMFFEMAGEILPLDFEGVEYSLLNVTECINCLDADKSEWITAESSGQRLLVEKYVFYENRYTESSLFKIPEERRGTIYTYERSGDPDEEFKAFVEEEKMTGLLFKEVWSSDE